MYSLYNWVDNFVDRFFYKSFVIIICGSEKSEFKDNLWKWDEKIFLGIEKIVKFCYTFTGRRILQNIKFFCELFCYM